MRKLLSIFTLVILYVTMAFGQQIPDVDIPLIITDSFDNPDTLYFGLDSLATNGIDTFLGELDLPGFPPDGFAINFTLTHLPSTTGKTYKDYRSSAPPPYYPFTGTLQHRVAWQYEVGATSLTFGYNLPVGVSIVISENASSPTWTSGTLTGSGSFIFNDPIQDYTSARIFVTYTNYSPPVAGPTFAIAPPLWNFGNVVVGAPSNRIATISNPGTEDLVVQQPAPVGDFSVTSLLTFPITIPPLGTADVTITFNPLTPGFQSGNLAFVHNAGSPYLFAVTGTGVGPGPTFRVEPTSLDFGNVNVGTPKNLTVRVFNDGAVNPLEISLAAAVPTPEYIVSPTSATILAGQNQVFTVTFTPSAPGARPGTLTFTDNDPSSPGTVGLTGNGVTPPPIYGLVFAQDTVERLENDFYMDVMQLKALDGGNLHSMQFRLQTNKETTDNVILTFQSITKGADISSPNWVLEVNLVRGDITANGASQDEIFVLLYHITGLALPPGDYNDLFHVNYRVAQLLPLQDNVKSTIKITNAEASDN